MNRLKDLRTPSPYDTVYQDDWQPYRPANALLAYGTDHFISGCSVQSALKFFDLRWHRGPASYRHTSALACVDTKPYPAPLAYRETAESQALPNGTRTSARCDHVRGLRCTWHALSVLDYYRPSYTAIVRVYGSMGGGLRGPADQNWRRRPLEAAVPDVSTARQRRGASRRAAEEHTSVYSLAHSSTFAPDFFVGVAGGVVVGRLRETGPGGPTAADDEPLDAWPPPQLTPSLPSPPPVQLAAATTPPDATLGSRHEQRLHVTILETGLGLVDPRATHADLVRTRVPRLLNAGQGFGIDMAGPTDTNLEKARRAWEAHHRLDRRFHSPDDLIEAPVELFIDRDHDQDDSSRQLSDRDGSQDDQDYF